MEKPVDGIEPEAMRCLESFDWPGNVRELENTIERSVALETGRHISVGVLPAKVSGRDSGAAVGAAGKDGAVAFPEEGVDFEAQIGATERRYIEAALERAEGVQRRAAELLKMSYHSFRHYAKKHKIQ
jgi:two-component system response regulator PilR (NtrC family)